MPIDVSKIQPKAKSRDEVIDSIVGGVFKEPESGVVDNQTGTGDKSGSGYVGKMSYPYDGKDLVVDVTDEIDGDGNTMVRDEGGNVLQVRAKDLKALPGVLPEKKKEREPGFWNTMFGDFLESFGSGLYSLNSGLWSIGDKVDKALTAVDPSAKMIKQLLKERFERNHPGETYKTIFEEQRDLTRDYAQTLAERADRYEGKDYEQLWKEGDYSGAFGDMFYTATQSIPQSAMAMAGGGAGLALTGAVAGAQKYDELDAMPELEDMPEHLKILNAVGAGVFEAAFERLGDAKIGKELMRMYRKVGKDQAARVVEDGVSAWFSKQFKRYGLLFAPVAEGVEEVATQVSNNVTDYCTGVTDEWNPLAGAGDSFVYGAMGGAQFAAVGLPGAMHKKYMKSDSRREYQKAREGLGKQFEGDDVDAFAEGLTFMSPAEQEASVGALARSGSYNQEQVDAVVDYVNKANRYRSWHDPKETEVAKAGKKELGIRVALRQFDEAMTPHVNEAGMVQQVVVAGMTEPVYVVKGDVIADEYGVIDVESSSQELYYQDAEGKMQVVTPGQIDRVELLIDVSEMRGAFENQLRHPEEYVQPEQPITDNEEAKSDRGVENGDVVVYRDEAGNEKEGVVSDAYSDAEHVFVQNGDVVPRGNVIGKAEWAKADVQEQEAETPVENVPDAPGFEIEKGVKAVKQEDGSYALDKVFSKSEREKAEKYVERLNQDYADEGVTWELKELPKSDPDNRLEKKMYGVVGRVEEVVPVENEIAEESIPETEEEKETEREVADESVKSENKIVNPVGISFQEAVDYYERIKPSEPDYALYFKIGDEYFVLNEDADRLADLKGVEAVVTPEGVRCVKVNFIDDAPLFIRELGLKPDVVDRKCYDKAFEKRVRSNKKKSDVKISDEAVIPEQAKVKEVVSEAEEVKPESGGFGSENKIITKDRYEELKRQWKEKTRGQLNVGFDPELLSIGTQMAMFHIEAGARKFADFAESMIEDIGVNIKPYLKSIYEGARYMPGMENVAKDMDKPDIVAIFSLDYMGVSVEEFDKDISAIREEKKQEKVEKKKKVSFSDVLEKKIRKRGWNVEHVVVGEVPKTDGKITEENNGLINRDNGQESGRNQDRGVPDRGGVSEDQVDVGLHTARNVPDVSGEQTERISDAGGRQSDGDESHADGIGHESVGSKRDDERYSALPDGEQLQVDESIDDGTDRGDRGVPEHGDPVEDRGEKGSNYVIEDPEHIVPGGKVGKLRANITAIRLLKQLEKEGRTATGDEQKRLSQYSGWGGLAEVLNKDKANIEGWEKEYGNFHRELMGLLTEDEYISAVNSTINAHYTPGHVIVSLWELAERLGFRGGKILEPAAGSGNFIGLMPSHLAERSGVVAYELDSLTGRILSYLYPEANVKVAGYETSKDRAFDLVITNVPFGQTAPYDPANKELSKFNLHNYFIAKGIRQLKPGGLGIFLTSYTSMDNGAGASFREWVGSEGNADFIGAIRLPNNAFSDNAGTEVTTDVLVFRKRDVNGVSPYAQPFRYALPVKETKTKEGKVVTIDVNEYFVNHPDMMLGEPFLAHQVNRGGLYSGDDFTLQARKGEDLGGALKEAVGKFASDVSNIEATPEGRVRLADNGEKEGSLIFRDGLPFEVQGGELVTPEWAGEYTTTVAGKRVARKEVARQYVELRETINQLVNYEVSEGEGIDELRKRLNDLYDGFVRNFGPLSRNLKLRFLKESDMGWSSVFGLEEEKQTFEEDGKGGFKKAYFIQKAEIFSKRVSFPVTEPTEASSLEDAIHISGAYRGRLDLGYVASLLGITEEAAKEKVLSEGLGFENPSTGLVEDRDTYLSKFVRKKLEEAKAAAETDERFKSNVEALEKVIPADIPPSLVRFNLGTTFIPGTFVERFVKEKLEVDATIRYVPSVNRWLITNVSNAKNPKNETVFGTKRIAGLDLVEKGLNMQVPLVYDTWEEKGHKIRQKNEEETIAAQAKLMEIKDAFVDFVSGNEEMMQELAQLYNEEYNGYVEKKYSVPAFKHYPGASSDIELRQHQKSAIPRILEGCTLLGHQVGSGKTFTIITGAMEMRRLKLAKKPMIVVQNQTLEQFVGSFKRLYPGAKLLAPTKGQMDAKNRVRLFNMISYGDYDAIIVPQSFVPMIPDNEERQKAYIKEQIAELESVLSEVDPESEKSLYSQLSAQLESFQDDLDGLDNQDAERGGGDKKGKKAEVVKTKAKRQLGIVKRISRQMDRKTDNIRTFEQLGVDALFVDEAHAYKKLGLVTKLANVRGIDKGGSKRAFSMYMKVQHIQEATGGKNVVYATGTPITNTMAELWTMMRYLAPDILKQYHIERFDEFASTFGSIEPSLEFTAAGNFKVVDRFKSYVNAPELMMAFRAFTDIVLSQDIPEFQDGKTLPKLKNGEFTQIIIKQSDGLKAVMVDLRKELTDWEKLSGKEKRKKRHIPLVVFNKAKQAAIDLRLLDPNFADDPDSKTNRVVKEVYRIYKESESYKGTQLVFSDMYQSPDDGNKYGRFNLYQDIKKKLVMLGIPEREIAIINDYKDSKREMLFEQMKTGEVRVLIGGTEKMGIGVNVQERLVAVHHVDAPPRPMDFEQRNGRIIRQGNIHAEMGIPIEILTYGVEKTLDATAYQRLMIKQGFINQMMKGDNLGREMEDYAAEDDASDLNFSQMMATLSGSQYAMLHQQRSFELKKLEMAEKNHERRLIELNKDLQNSLRLVDYYVALLSDLEEQKKFYGKYFPDRKIKSVKIGDKVYNEKLAEVLDGYFEELLKKSLKKVTKLTYSFYLNGCERPVKIRLDDLTRFVCIYYEFFPTDGKNDGVCSFVQTGQGFITSFSRLIGKVVVNVKDIEDVENKKRINSEKIPVLREELKKPFDKAEKLEELRKEVEEIEELMQKEVINDTGVDHKAIEARDAEENETGVIEDTDEIREDVPVISDVTADAHSVASPAEYEGELALPVTKTKHTKTGADLYVVKIRDRVGKDVFGSLKRTAKDYGGGWSNFTKGFNFSSEEKAEKFREAVNGLTPESEDVLFREVEDNRQEAFVNEDIFYSNAEFAVKGVKQEKATPQQWLAMIEKNGGLKVGEDEWLGLSEWLKGYSGKSLTRQEVLDYISAHKIPVFETELAGLPPKESWDVYKEKPETDYYLIEKKLAIHDTAIELAMEGKGNYKDLYEQIKKGEGFQEEYNNVLRRSLDDILIYNTGNNYIVYDPNADHYIMDKKLYGSFEDAINSLVYSLISPIRMKYTMKGLDMYRELVLVVPTIEAWEQSDPVHFGDTAGGKGVVWMRFGDSRDKSGRRVLVIDEIQSRRHQEGKKSGYVKDFYKTLESRIEFPFAQQLRELYLQKLDGVISSELFDARSQEVKDKAVQSGLDLPEVENVYSRYYTGFGKTSRIPDAPFAKNWHEVAFKRMLRYAAENGYDTVAWTKGEQQYDRYDSARSHVEKVRWTKYKDGLYSLYFSYEGNLMEGEESFEDCVAEKIQAEGIRRFLSADLADRILKSDKNRGSFKTNFAFGYEGLGRLYDEVIPNFARKYVKKWGTDVGEVTLPEVGDTGRVMWSVEVTPEMKESVMQGQPLFKEDAPGMRGERARIEREVMRLEKALKVRVNRVRSRDELPERIRKMMHEGKRYPGVYSGKDGRVYVVLDEVTDVAEAQRTVLHEVVGHKGIRVLFGGELGRFNDLVLASMSEGDREAYLKRYKNNREVAAQEFVAGFAERYSDPAVWERIKGFVRDCLRRMGVNLKLSDGDLMYLLWRGVRQIREGDGALEVAGKVSRDYALFKEAEDNYSVNMEVVSEVELDDADRLKLHNEVASRRFQFLEAYQDRMLAVKNFQELIEQKLGRNLPDYMNAYLFENTLASRNTYETEHFRNTLLCPLTQVLATLEGRSLSRRSLENYVMAKHGLERNEYMRAKRLEEWYEPLASNLEAMKDFMTEQSYEKAREELEEMRELKKEQLKDADFSGLSAVVKELPDEDVNAFIQEIENVYGDDISRLWECIRRATEFSVRKWYECGNMTKENYEKVKGMYKHYVPLRQFDETIASDVYEYFDEPKNSFNSPLRRANGRNSRAANVFANIFSMAESAVIGGNKNLLKLHLFHLAEKYPSSYLSVHKYWYAEAGIDEEGKAVFEAVIPEYSDDPAVYRENVRRFNRRMEEMQLEGRAYPSRSKLNVNLRLLNDEPNEHIVRVRVVGEEYAVLVNGDPRVAQAINGTNDEERTDNRVVKAIRAMNRQMAANFTTRNPAFVVSNLTRDFIFAVTALSVKEGSRYRNRFVRNIPAASGAIRRYLAGNPDYKRKEDVLFDVFLKNGGETGYTALYNIEKYKKLIEREIKNTKRGEAVNAGMKILDFFEAGNRWAEDLSRFSTFMTSREMRRSVLRSVSDAKEVTVNFNRKGSGANGAQVFRSLYLFFNAAVQSLANFGGMAVNHPKRTAAMLASYAAVGAMVPVLLMGFGGDDALKEYLNLPDYVRKNNLCLYLGSKHGFITIPLPIELRAFFSWGDSFFRYMAGDVAGDTACGEVIMGMLDLLPLNPVGGDTPFMPDALKPITQSFYTNKDFTGRPIARITPYNRYVPEYKRVYRGTGEFFVKSSEVLNYMTGGDYATKGVLDKSGQVLSDLFSADVSVTNPAAIEHLFESYLGGTFTTMNQAMKTVWDLGKLAVTGKNEVEARNVPVLNRFYNTGSLHSSQAKTNEKYFNALDELRETQSRISRYQEAMGNGEMKLDEATENYGRMVNDGIVERAEVIKFYSGEISKMNQAINSHGLPDEEVDELENEIYLLKEQMLAELEKVKSR